MSNLLKFTPIRMSKNLINGLQRMQRINRIVSTLNSIEQGLIPNGFSEEDKQWCDDQKITFIRSSTGKWSQEIDPILSNKEH